MAEQITALTLPFILPAPSDIAGFAELPELPLPLRRGERGPAPESSQLDGVRKVADQLMNALIALQKHQNQCAALNVLLIEKLHAMGNTEGALLAFDHRQQSWDTGTIDEEIALVLGHSTRCQMEISDQSIILVRQLPATLKKLHDGELPWPHARLIADEVRCVRDAGVSEQVIAAFEQTLLGKAENCSITSFRQKARRLRERCYPETLVPRTRRAYEGRYLSVNRGSDGTSWLSLYGPSPTIEAIWMQCTATAQAAQGPHEQRTLSQLRADVAMALLLRHSMSRNGIAAPAIDLSAVGNAGFGNSGSTATAHNTAVSGGTAPDGNPPTRSAAARPSQPERSAVGGCEEVDSALLPSAFAAAELYGFDPCTATQGPFLPPVESCAEGGMPADPGPGDPPLTRGQIPRFDDPRYSNSFREPPPWDDPDWPPGAQPPRLERYAGPSDEDEWPPLPEVKPILLIPALSMLGETVEPAWLEGAGPISIEVAHRLTANAPSLFRMLVHPLTGQPLDHAPDCYRIDAAMRAMLRIRDEFCQFPNCNARAVNTNADHIKKFSSGGRTTFDNLESLCRRHHILKHFKDDRTAQRHLREEQSPERRAVTLRGWTPRMTENGKVGWTTPTGRYVPPEAPDLPKLRYPEWLKDTIEEALTFPDWDIIDEQLGERWLAEHAENCEEDDPDQADRLAQMILAGEGDWPDQELIESWIVPPEEAEP